MKKLFSLINFILIASISLFAEESDYIMNDVTVDVSSTNEDFIRDFVHEDIDSSYLFSRDKLSYRYRIGVGNALSIVYYRRSFGLSYDIFADVRLVRGLYLESGLKVLLYQYSITHFYPIVVNHFENIMSGSYGGLRIALKYRFDLLEHFGLLIGSGFLIGMGVYSMMDYMHDYGDIISCIGLELSPEFSIGATIPFGRYRFDIMCFKWLPIIPTHYNYNDRTWRNYNDYQLTNSNNAYSPMRPICWSAMGITVSFTYFIM